MTRKAIIWVAALALTGSVAGCRVHTESNANGKDNNVRVDTPFGDVHVTTNQIRAADLGLPAYPGAEKVSDEEHKSADVHVGFGEWQMRVRTVSYSSPDPRDKVAAFYKTALARYGDVLTCQGSSPVGTPTTTSEGLTCAAEQRHPNAQINGNPNGYDIPSGLHLLAGSKHHLHLVGFEDQGGGTRFALIAIDLPTTGDGKSD
jgi:hypothetical protein